MSNQYPMAASPDNALHDEAPKRPHRTSTDISDAVARPRGPESAAATDRRTPFVQRPTCTIAEACNAVGLGRTKLYELIGGGEIDTITIGRRRLVRVPSLLKLLKIDSV
jgi:excisionase family DNA binding protein